LSSNEPLSINGLRLAYLRFAETSFVDALQQLTSERWSISPGGSANVRLIVAVGLIG
jgi:hypothetical protein